MDEKKEDYRNRWQKENQERIIVMVPRGKKDNIKDQAESRGMSVNAYIVSLIEKDMEKSPRQ